MCCGGGRRQIRKQTIERKGPRQSNAARRQSATVGSQNRQVVASRQHISSGKRCVKCGYVIMTVNIAGRERFQCSNPNCRLIVK